MSKKQMQRALSRAVKARQPQLYSDAELGEVWITETALSRYSQSLSRHGCDPDLAKQDLARNVYKVWAAQLQFLAIGQAEFMKA
jgi:hypothetical protein